MTADELDAALRRCLDADDPDAALVRLVDQEDVFRQIAMGEGAYGSVRPPEVVGVAIHLAARAMIRRGRAGDARPFIDKVAAGFDWGYRHYARASAFSDLVEAFPFLWVPGILASTAEKDWAGAITAILWFRRATKNDPDGAPPREPAARHLIDHPEAAAYGPFRYDPRWVLERQEAILHADMLDRRLEETWNFYQLLVETALMLGEPARALPLVETVGLDLVEIGDTTGGHFQFDAICVLAALGRREEAMAAAEQLVRHGYGQAWRFDLDAAANMAWTQRTRQNEYLADLAGTPRYGAFLRGAIAFEEAPPDDPTRNALCAVREDKWGGKAKKRCWLSRNPIATGDPIVRTRCLYHRASDGDFEIAGKAAFDASGWAEARRLFEADRVPLGCLFPPLRSVHSRWHTPAISAFHFDVANDAAAFDLDRAAALVADHAPNPIRHEWTRGKYDYAPAFEPFVNDQGHGDAVNLTWRLLKAGSGAELFKRFTAMDQARADKVFAMLAVFDRSDCRTAAAVHFDLAELPAMMTLAFADRPSLDAHLAMAGFADANPRWRAGLVAAMRAYALHLYSNYQSATDWFLAGLEHFTRARGCQLLYFLIHHPEDDDVLRMMIEKRWLPSGVGTGGFDAYDNASAFYYRAAVFHLMIHAPDQLDFWRETEWLGHYCGTSKDRETRRLLTQYRKAHTSTPTRRRKGRP